MDGRYSKHKLLTDFTAMMPADKPKYLMMIMIDEPQGRRRNPRLCHRRRGTWADRAPR